MPQIRKNFHTLLPLIEKNPELHLVIAGINTGSYATRILELAKSMEIEDRVHLPGPVNSEQKYWLYQNCKAFMFPSLLEGFGLPVVDAMSLGKPVFLSNLTSLPEVGGPEAYYWNNFDADSMNEIFKNGMRDFNSARAARSIEWSKQFSWEAVAKSYLKLYSEI